MKLQFTFVVVLMLLCADVVAQNCNEESLKQQCGAWEAGPEGSVSGISATDLASEKKTVAALHAMVKSKYVPMGLNATFSGAYDTPYSTMPGNAYHYSIYPMQFYCEGSTIKTVHETSTYFSIGANLFDVEIYDTAPEDNLTGYFTMDNMAIEKDGYYYFKERDASLGMGVTGKNKMWLVTFDGKLPFAYVSKKDFLIKRKQTLAYQLNQSASGSKDVLANLEIEKKYKEVEFKNDPGKLQKYIRIDYSPRKDRYEKLLAQNEGDYHPAFDKIDNLLKMPAAELSTPAIVKQDPHDHLSYLFTNDDDPFGRVLIQPNPGYFNKKLPRSSPQFFLVYISGDNNNPVTATAMTDIIEAIDFSILKSLLGK